MTVPARSFQHYEVLRREDGTPWELGRGAMGVTYKAFDVNLCCEVALKVVSSALVEHPEARERFVREARAAAALRHRNVASVYHLGNDGEHFFYAMEFIKGDTLDALVRREGPLSVENALQVVLQVARALAAAERQHLVHRDIKPANLMVTHEDADEETVVKVIDFGLARAAATAENAAPLTIGGFVGTPQYASPEQLEERPLDARSDLYSLGVTAWFLLTGRVPFTGSLATICQQQLTHPPPWDQLPATVPTCVRGLLGHLLAKDPARRPQNAAELRAEIEACLEKIRGTERKRDLHLPALPPTAPTTRHGQPKTTERALQAGSMLNGRYRLLRHLGGSHGVRVYQARDESEGDRVVAVRVLPAGLASDPTGWNSLVEEVRLVQAATHPRLVQIHALDRCSLPAATFLVEEWLAGFTVRDLIAARGGRLPVMEALSLLEQAAAAADHAARCRLEPLELAPTDLHVTFPMPGGTPGDDSQVRTLLPKRFVEWPEWTLKIHALRPNHDPSIFDTWAGNVTLMPTPGRDDTVPVSAGEPSATGPVRALAELFYELLGVVPMVRHPSSQAQPARYSSLPVLNEEANGLLRQAVSGESAFAHGWQLHEALTEAIGNEPSRHDARFAASKPEPGFLAGVAGTPTPQTTPPDRRESTRESTVTSRTSLAEPVFPDGQTGTGSGAPFFRVPNDLLVPDPEETPAAGSAWDRLTLVTEKRAHPGRWLAGIVVLGAMFVLGFVGVLIWLLQQPPSRGAVLPTVKKRSAEPPVGRPVPRQSTPAPLAAHPPASALPIPTPPHHESSLPLVRTASAQVDQPPVSTPTGTPRAENTFPPSPAVESSSPKIASVKDRLATVHLESVPEGAQIRLRGELLGTTPLRTSLPRGEHQLIARYRDWPETRQTVHIDGTETQTTVEIRIMRPDLVPGSVVLPTATPDHRVRRAPALVVHRALYTETPVPSAAQVSPTPAVTPTPNVSEPEVRPAQRVLTPFRIDEPPATSPPPSNAPNRQPFSADGDDDN